MIMPMRAEDESDVKDIYKLCHPAWPERAPFWYFAHPTLICLFDKRVVAFTSFTLTVMPGFGSTMYGIDVCVHPEFRGQGIADKLHAERLKIAKAVGATTFMGVAHRGNKKMATILKRAGAHVCLATSENDVLFVSSLKGT